MLNRKILHPGLSGNGVMIFHVSRALSSLRVSDAFGPARRALCLWLASAVPGVAADVHARPFEIHVEDSSLSRLVRQLATGSDHGRRELAVLAIGGLRNDYAEALQASAADRPRLRAERFKLARWQRATSSLIAELDYLREALDSGATLSLHLDRHDQLLVVVGGQPIVVSGTGSDGRELEQRVVAEYCAYNDCSALVSAPLDESDTRVPGEGVWLLRQGRRPTFEIESQIRFAFDRLADRTLKAEVSRRAATELDRLFVALSRARAKGYQIDWEQLMRSPLSEGFEQTVVVNRTGVYLRLQLPLLASLHVADWERVVHWMSQGGRRRDNVLLIEHADRLEARYRSL